MELSPYVIEHLSAANALKDTEWKSILTNVVQSFRVVADQVNTTDKSNEKLSIDAKKSLEGLSLLFAEAIRNDWTGSEVQSILEDIQFNGDYLPALVSAIDTLQKEINNDKGSSTVLPFSSFSSFASTLPFAVDLQYNLSLHSNVSQLFQTPTFILTFTCLQRKNNLQFIGEAEEKKFTFIATLEEVVDLSAKIKDALNSVTKKSEE